MSSRLWKPVLLRQTPLKERLMSHGVNTKSHSPQKRYTRQTMIKCRLAHVWLINTVVTMWVVNTMGLQACPCELLPVFAAIRPTSMYPIVEGLEQWPLTKIPGIEAHMFISTCMALLSSILMSGHPGVLAGRSRLKSLVQRTMSLRSTPAMSVQRLREGFRMSKLG